MKTAREAVGADVEIMVDAGGSEEFWPHGYKTPSASIEEIVTAPFALGDDGYLEIPTAAGLGVELDRERVEHFARAKSRA